MACGYCTIDKRVTGDTSLRRNKIDNQVHVGHDTVMEKCLIASQTGIAGCVIEDEVTIWGQVGQQWNQ
jgi:UDP-3-O-[3-hydroxymyristoyl] glucosamine N-acyltransferase